MRSDTSFGMNVSSIDAALRTIRTSQLQVRELGLWWLKSRLLCSTENRITVQMDFLEGMPDLLIFNLIQSINK